MDFFRSNKSRLSNFYIGGLILILGKISASLKANSEYLWICIIILSTYICKLFFEYFVNEPFPTNKLLRYLLQFIVFLLFFFCVLAPFDRTIDMVSLIVSMLTLTQFLEAINIFIDINKVLLKMFKLNPQKILLVPFILLLLAIMRLLFSCILINYLYQIYYRNVVPHLPVILILLILIFQIIEGLSRKEWTKIEFIRC